MDRLKTGVPGFDGLVSGGFPKAFSILVSGSPGCGKTIFSLHFLKEGLAKGEKCAYMTYSQTPKDLVDQAAGFGWDMNGVEFVRLKPDDFVEALSGHEHARSLATISGSLRENPLENVIETFSSAAPTGTLRLSRGTEEGKIVYRDDTIVSVTCGLVSGAKALGRMFGWDDAVFEFEPEAEVLDVADAPLPLTSVVLAASVERDELARLDLGSVDDETVFTVDAEQRRTLESSLDDLGRELVTHVEMGFPVGALLDILPISDAVIYQKLAELIEAGIVRPVR